MPTFYVANITITASFVGVEASGVVVKDTIQRVPIAPQTFQTTIPPGVLTTASPAEFTKLTLVSGNNVVNTNVSGFTSSYLVLVPPTGSTVIKTLKGANTDTGVVLANTSPVILGLSPTFNQYIINASAGETLDSWLI